MLSVLSEVVDSCVNKNRRVFVFQCQLIIFMADSDWKKRVGIEINFSPESSDDERASGKSECDVDENADRLSPRYVDSTEGSLEGLPVTEEDYLNLLVDAYGTTPPRARIRRKERRHREKEELSSVKKSPKVFYTMRSRRRNTLDSIYLDGLVERCETQESAQVDEDQYLTESNKRTKRSMKLLRGSERDMKLEQADVPLSPQPAVETEEEKTESLPAVHPQRAIKVESCNRFMSLTSKPVECQKKCARKIKAGQEKRVELPNKISHLIRTGCGDKQADKLPWRQLSQEEHLWQNELKDLIWLELQAWHADRTLTEQDEYLCQAREKVGTLLDDIMNYSFQLHPSSYPSQQLSAQSSDSGLSVEGMDDCMLGESEGDSKPCPPIGCLSVYCHSCVRNQMAALKDVEQLLNRLEAAEALYPSSKAFASHFPLYKSPNFIGRVKAMCIWYNMTKHHRLKLLILGKHFTHNRNPNWPTFGEEDSGIATDTSGGDASPRLSRSDPIFKAKSYSKVRKRTVQFDTGSTTSSPSDSNNSNISHEGGDVADCLANCLDSQPMSVTKGTACCFSKNVSCVNPFRKYIEEILKTKGLRKSLYFLEKLHKHILVKSVISLSKPVTESSSQDIGNLDVNANDSAETLQDGTDSISVDQFQNDEEELRRYGYWSEIAQSLQLPSYRSAFLFLAHIPLDTIYELLQMRLEQKPANPSVLCIRQLMRELKEGLRMAALHRERYLSLIRASLWDVDDVTLKKYEDLSNFDHTCDAVLHLYLEYLEQWVPMVQHERFQKNLLEEEWQFVKSTCMSIPGAPNLVGNVFCHIASGMMKNMVVYWGTKFEEVMVHKEQETGGDESSTKQVAMMVCREFQALFNEMRHKSYKAVGFTKSLIKDLERDEFVMGAQDKEGQSLSTALKELQLSILKLRFEIASAMQSIEEIFMNWDMDHVDDAERLSLISRFREILHLGYKLTFEFHKEICRAFLKEMKPQLVPGYISFAYQWIDFVKEWCEQGKGCKPRWAVQGLEFLMFVSDPVHTSYLSDDEFQRFQSAVEKCVSYVIGTASPVSEKRTSSPHIFHSGRGSIDGQRPRSRASSPASRTKSPSYRTSRSMLDTGVSPSPQVPQRSLSANPSFSSDVEMNEDVPDGYTITVRIPSKGKVSRIERVRSAIKSLENSINNKLLQQELIGSVTDIGSEDRIHIKSRSVTFSWQRGMKIGQGRFGKVYTAVNNETGELLAMKEIQLQPNDHRTIRRVAEELRTFEGITHRSLVRYYGVEIHREEMLIFMEFCAEGTLESLVAATECGLPETLFRRYTHQLLDAVCCLHRHGVVHRDIKSANIFLTDEGNSLKLGDFGSAVKIKAHTTLPGELQGFVGTQAYMAPEVFMKTNTDGHGRAADIWSVGCVVVEMASGKRPWAEYDSNYQIMFKVGMGETPHAPPTLSEEGHHFLNLCLQHDPRERASANNLMLHSFVKVDSDEDYSSTLPSVLEDYLKLSSMK